MLLDRLDMRCRSLGPGKIGRLKRFGRYAPPEELGSVQHLRPRSLVYTNDERPPVFPRYSRGLQELLVWENGRPAFPGRAENTPALLRSPLLPDTRGPGCAAHPAG